MSKVLVDGKRAEATDNEGNLMPTLVYLAREKRPEYFHNFKAGAMNALVRTKQALPELHKHQSQVSNIN